jgi:prolyl oligopeptidase
MRSLLLALLASTSLMTTAVQAADPVPPANTEARTPLTELGKDDPYKWMEEIEGERPLAWAKAQNARSLAVLQGDARYAGLESEALAILNAKDRVPNVSFAGDGSMRNFWQDAEHVRGLWRKTTLESYRTATPVWETILDIDALSKAENANWVFKGANSLPPTDTRCLGTLSNGGKDAVSIREFDTVTKAFVPGGFDLPEGKQNVDWLDKDTLLVAREWEPGQVTKSSYPYVVKTLKRGQALADAKEVFRGTPDDVSAGPSVIRDSDGVVQAVLAYRGVSFFESETYLLTQAEPVKLPFPLKHSIQGYVGGQLVLSLEQDWAEKGFKTGDLISFDLKTLKADPAKAPATLVLRPTARQSVEQVTTTRGKLIVGLLDNVTGVIQVHTPGPKGWSHQTLALPANSTLAIGSTSEKDERLFVAVTGYLTPSTYWLADAGTLKLEQVKALGA